MNCSKPSVKRRFCLLAATRCLSLLTVCARASIIVAAMLKTPVPLSHRTPAHAAIIVRTFLSY